MSQSRKNSTKQPCCRRCISCLKSWANPHISDQPVACKNWRQVFHQRCVTGDGKTFECPECGTSEFKKVYPVCRRPNHGARRPLPQKRRATSVARPKKKRKTKKQTTRKPISFQRVCSYLFTIVFFSILFLGIPAFIDGVKDQPNLLPRNVTSLLIPPIFFLLLFICLRPKEWLLKCLAVVALVIYFRWIYLSSYLKLQVGHMDYYFLIFTLVLLGVWLFLIRLTNHQLYHSKLDNVSGNTNKPPRKTQIQLVLLIAALAVVIFLGAYQLFKNGYLPDSNPNTFAAFSTSQIALGLCSATVFVLITTILSFRILSKISAMPLLLLGIVAIGIYFNHDAISSRLDHWLGKSTRVAASAISATSELQTASVPPTSTSVPKIKIIDVTAGDVAADATNQFSFNAIGYMLGLANLDSPFNLRLANWLVNVIIDQFLLVVFTVLVAYCLRFLGHHIRVDKTAVAI